ncbi:MAG: PKD domain-containing protein, partial [Thermaurantimonas sp.]|uniref:PKD domain-containing protein n=1 Tax=Thermaurantimonas sp. TaxID=2681568 RepID=UPI00391B1198
MTWVYSNGGPFQFSFSNPLIVSYTSSGIYPVHLDTNNAPAKSIYVFVGTSTPVTLNLPKDTFCLHEGTFPMSAWASPPGGTWSGPGVSNNTWNTSAAGTGNKTLTYTFINEFGCTTTVNKTVHVLSAPVLNLFANGDTITIEGVKTYYVCSVNPSVTFTLAFFGSGGYSSYKIFVNNVLHSQGAVLPPTLNLTFTTPGFYPVTVELTNSAGCTTTQTINLFYGSNPAIGIGSPGNTVACLPKDGTGVTFTFPINNFQNNPPGTKYIVQVSDGSPPIVFNHPPPPNFTYTFFQPSCGNSTAQSSNAFSVTITAVNPCLTTSATIFPIVISKSPVAGFTVPDTVCANDPVKISDTSNKGIRTFFSSGNYNCDSTGRIVWSITPNTFVVDSGFLGIMTNPANPTQWISGTKDIVVRFLVPGYYTIWQYVGNDQNCEIDSIPHTICVAEPPNGDIQFIFPNNDSSFCAPFELTFFDPGDTMQACLYNDWHWSITPDSGYTITQGDTNMRIFTALFHQIGQYTITLTKTNFCGTLVIDTVIRIKGKPFINMPPPVEYCGPTWIHMGVDPLHQYEFYDSLGAVNYTWSISPATGWSLDSGSTLNDSLPKIFFHTPGVYWIKAKLVNECGEALDSQRVEIYPLPQVGGFNDTIVCFNDTFQYTPPITGGLPPYSIFWQASTGASDSSATIILNNITQSTTVTYYVTDSRGCKDTATFLIQVYPEIQISVFGPSFVCIDGTATFTASATGGTGPKTFQWSPSNGLSSTTSPTVTLNASQGVGKYYVTVTDSIGCSRTDSISIDIIPLPVAAGGGNKVICLGDSVLIGNPASGTNKYLWITSSNDTVGHQAQIYVKPTVPTTYILVVRDSIYECKNYDTVQVTFIANPVANFSLSASGICEDSVIQTTNLSTPNIQYAWYVNGNFASNLVNPSFTFTNASHTQDSTIVVKLVVTAGTGCKDSVTQSVTVYPRPLAQFSIPSPVCATSTVTAVNTSQGKGLSYQWYVSDPAVLISNATAAAPTFTFPDNQTATPITYTISLAVTSTDDCKDSAWQAVVVNPRPTAAFQLPAPACSPAVLQPTNQSTGSGLQYAWSITPAVSSTGLNTATPTFNLPLTTSDSAVYTLKLVVTDANGCVDSLSKQYWVYPKPKADFTASSDTVCDGVAITFVSTSSSNQNGVPQLSHQWNFGNGQTSTDSLPSPVVFVNTGTQDTTYSVRLIVTNAFGCVDTVHKNILVRPNAKAQLQVNAAFDCAPFKIDTSVVKAVHYPFANATYTWKIFDKNFNVLSTQTGQHALNHTIV